MKKNNYFLSFLFSFFCFVSFDLKASDSHLKDNDELDQKPPNAPSKILQVSKETLKFYVGNSTQPDSMKNKVVNTGRYAALHFVPFDLLSTGDSPIASISNGARFFLMGQAIHQLGYLASQETDQEKKTIIHKTRFIFSAHLLFDALISLSEYTYGEEAFYSVASAGAGAVVTALGCFYMLYLLSNAYTTQNAKRD